MSEILPRRTVRYFLSYAHADEGDVKQFLAVIEPLLKGSADFRFERWSDHQIRLGSLGARRSTQRWRRAISV